jgi:Mg/Co/Ni transporter MgtE
MPYDERHDVLAAMEADRRVELGALLAYDEETAGGFMTSELVRLNDECTVQDAIDALNARTRNVEETSGIVVVDADGRLVDDVSVVQLLGVAAETRLKELVGPPWPVTVPPDADLAEIVENMTDNRGSSVLVVDNENRPVGRILADDVVDALVRDRDRRWPWQRRAGGTA